MVYTDEQVKLLRQYGQKIKINLGNKVYTRFRMLAYYFPEIIDKHRLDRLYFCLNIDNSHFSLKLKNYTSGESYYKKFEHFLFTTSILMSDEVEYYMHSDNFFDYFHI